MLREQDAAFVRAFVRDVAVSGIPRDGLVGADVIAVKFEYFFEDLALTAYRVTRNRFGDATAVLALEEGRAGLVDGASRLTQAEFDRCVAQLTDWIVDAWRTCPRERVHSRAFLGPHDDLYMVDLDQGPPVRRVDFDRWDEPASQ